MDNTDSQDLTISGNVLSLSGDATPVTLPTVDGSETVINNGTNTTVNGSGTTADPYTIDVPSNTDSQDLSISGDALSLSGDPTATPIDLSGYTNDDTNELITSFGINGTDLRITEAGINFDVPLSSLGTDSQDLSISGDALSLSGDPTATPIDLSGYLDNTDSQDLTISGNVLSLSGDATPVTLPTVDGSETVINNGTNTTVNGSGTTADPYTIDVPSNTDSQDLSISGDALSLSGDPTATPIDLSGYTNDDTNELITFRHQWHGSSDYRGGYQF